MQLLSKNRTLIAASVLVALSMAACSSGGGGSATEETPVTANIAGKVSGTATTNTTSSISFFAKAMKLLGIPVQTMTTDTCASGSFTGAYVGGGGAQAVSGTFSSGAFTVPSVVQGKEMIITFTCDDNSTQRCLVKSGDTGVGCNPVADSVIGAFESALSKTVYDTSFAGKSIAKVGSAIVQAAETDGTATEAFNETILTCKALAADLRSACYLEAIKASPFAGAFKLMQTMVNGWSVDALFTLMVDVYGAKIGVDSFMFTDFATSMDTWLGSDFVAQTRAYIAAVVADQLAGGNTYVTKLECQMWYNKFQSGGTIRYAPVMATIGGISQPTCKNTTAYTANGFSAGQITAINAAIDSDNHGMVDLSAGSVGCNGNVFNTTGAYCVSIPRLSITSKYVESNRNDPSGERGSDFYNAPEVNMIGTFPELMTEMQAFAASDPASCMSMGNDGPPVIAATTQCQNWFGGFMATQKNNFAGLMGLYAYLKGTSGNTLLSLDDIHKLFVGSTFLNSKLALRGNNQCGAQITGGNGNYLPALATFSNGIFTAQAGFGCSPGGQNTITSTNAATAVAAATVPYEASFKMFENIPSVSEINKFVFGASYHTEWNPTGSKQFWAAGIQNSGFPIFCRMTDSVSGKSKESELDSTSSISCLTQAQLAALPTPVTTLPDENGLMTLPKGYPYVLTGYGFQGDGKGLLFALSDAKTGMQVRAGGGNILIQQLHAGNAGQCNGTDYTSGQVFTAKLNMGFGSSTQQQAVKVYCMDMSAFQESGSYMLYNGGMVSIKQVNDDGTSWGWDAPQIGARDPNSTTGTVLPLCYFADTSSPGFTTSSTTGLTASANSGTVTAAGEISVLGSSDSIDLCSATPSGKTKYYLIMMGNSMNTDRTALKVRIIGSTTGSRVLQYKNWGDAGVTNWEDMLIHLKPAVVEAAYNGGGFSSGCTSGNASTCKAIAPTASQTPVRNIRVANQRWNAKYDPYCDDRNANGKCDCYVAGTTTAKDANECTLADDAAEPTLSQPPYWVNQSNAAAMATLFSEMGGKAGADLQWRDAPTNSVAFNGQYLNSNQLWFDTSSVFLCQFKATGESIFRSPTQLSWNNFGALDHKGCPATDGGAVTSAGGPIRMIKPVAAANTYSISRPNTLIKMINYATKSSGQGISISRTTKKFTFDEALALVSLRQMMPASEVPVYVTGTTEANANAIVKGAMLSFEPVRVSNDGDRLDIVGAVLRAITRPAELTGN